MIRPIVNKKGDVGSIMIVMVVLFIMFIVGIVGLTMWEPLKDELVGSEIFNESTQAQNSFEKVDSAFGMLDLFVWISFVAFIGGLIVSALYIQVHPVFIGLFVLLLIVGVFVAAQLSNVVGEMTEEESLDDAFTRMPVSKVIFGKYFPLWILGAGAITIIILYGKGEGVA